MNIAFVTNSPAPYRIRQINKFCEIDGINLRVYYTQKESGRDWQAEESLKTEEIKLKGVRLFTYSGFDVRLNLGLLKLVRDHDLILIGGYEQLSYLMLSALCKLCKKSYILVFDGIQPQKIGAPTRFLKRSIIAFIAKNARAIFANGTVSRQYFMRNYHISESRIYNQYLTSNTLEIRRMLRFKDEISRQMKNKYAISRDKFVIICVSRLIPLKNIKLLIRAVGRMEEKESAVLLLVGDGPERSYLEDLARIYRVSAIFTGNIPAAEEVIKHLMAADLFVFPTFGEAWGLVVNEAMAAGLTILCSSGAGASVDLVKNGVNGYTFEPDDDLDLSLKISRLMNDREQLKRFGEASRMLIRDWTFDRSKHAFHEMLKREKFLK